MSLNSTTTAKILREHFTGETPIIKNAFEHQEFISSIKLEINKISKVNIEKEHSYSWDKIPEQTCYFSVDDGSPLNYRHDSFTIKFNDNNELIITNYRHTAIIYQIDQIYSFIDKLKLEHENRNARKLKKEKVNQLKQHAIFAKIKELAKEDKFDFYVTEYKIKLKLIVRLEEDKTLEIDIPYGKFQEILKDLRSMINTIRDLQKSGITFRLKPSGRNRHRWITHNSL